MSRLVIHQRWLPLPWGVYTGVLAIIFGGIGVYSWFYTQDEPTARMATPLYAVFVYWVLASLFNVRTVVITPRLVWDVVWPFPVRLPRWVKRDDIRYCCLRNFAIYDDGTKLESHYTVGVETMAGQQINVSSPHHTADEANQIVTEMVRILNEEPAGRRIEAVEIGQSLTRVQMLRTLSLALFWLVVSIAAIFLGAAWEEEHRLRRRAGS